MADPVQMFGIPNCDTIKKARAWLRDNDLDYEFHNYKTEGVDELTLRNWVSAVGWETLVNRKGTTWRKLPEQIKNNIEKDGAIKLMIENPSLIKRPVLVKEAHIEVGFKAEQYAELFE